MIDVLVPVLGRPDNAIPLITSLTAASHSVSRVLFLCSESDTEEIKACRMTTADVIECAWKPKQGDYARKMNEGFRQTDSEFVFLAADDVTFHPGWDDEALAVAFATKAGVIATNDMNNPQVKKGLFGTHCLVRRSYVMEQGGSLEGPGHLLSERYDHNFVDRELCHLADQRGMYAFAEHSHVVHNWRAHGMDATYEKGIKNFRHDQRLFLRRIRGLPT